jgi:methyl-accepting chemotaxis protein
MEAGIQVIDKGRELVDKAGTSLNEIVTTAHRVTEMIQQMATSAQEQSGASEQISKNIEHISGVTKEAATGAAESSAAAEELSRQAESLRVMVERYKINGADLQILSLARNDHLQYMKRLKAVLDGDGDPKSWVQSDHHACRLGKWYYSGGKIQYGEHPEFQAIEPPHDLVHRHGNECVRMVLHKDKASAQRSYDLALASSRDVVARLSEMEQAFSGSSNRSVVAL